MATDGAGCVQYKKAGKKEYETGAGGPFTKDG